ncbi:lysine transporter LysE [Streptomyces virginiae]|uniref:lysine transporter LysE n=1 Tax=Streptomyces virginiae TaxID=1961 RepID=UPI00342F7FB1
MGVRRVAKGVSDFLVETVGEVVAEVLLSLLACAVLGALVLIAHLSWSFSPRVTLAGAGLLSLALAHGAWTAFRAPAKGRGRRGLAAVTSFGFLLTAATAAYLLFYATGCDCP